MSCLVSIYIQQSITTIMGKKTLTEEDIDYLVAKHCSALVMFLVKSNFQVFEQKCHLSFQTLQIPIWMGINDKDDSHGGLTLKPTGLEGSVARHHRTLLKVQIICYQDCFFCLDRMKGPLMLGASYCPSLLMRIFFAGKSNWKENLQQKQNLDR